MSDEPSDKVKRIADALGASRVVPLADGKVRGPLDLLRLRRLVERLRGGSR